MDHKASTIVLLAVLAAFALACAFANQQHSAEELDPDPPSLMVQQTSDIPLYLLTDPEEVPSEKTVLFDGQDRGSTLSGVDYFVHRDLKSFFDNFFDEVHVVDGTRVDDADPHLFVNTRVQRVELQPTGGISAGVMTWGLGLGYSEADEYLFSFAGDSAGAPSGQFDRLFRSMFEAAISDLASAYSEKDVHEAILELPETDDSDSLEAGTQAQHQR